jgi:hypothetical protein
MAINEMVLGWARVCGRALNDGNVRAERACQRRANANTGARRRHAGSCSRPRMRLCRKQARLGRAPALSLAGVCRTTQFSEKVD